MLTTNFTIRCNNCGASEDTEIKGTPTEKDGVGVPGWLVMIYCPKCHNVEFIAQQEKWEPRRKPKPKPDCG